MKPVTQISKKVVFWTSTENTAFLYSLINSLRMKGVDVSLAFAVSEEEYRNAQSPLKRIIIRFRQYVIFPIRAFFVCLVRRNSTINICTTNPFYLPCLVSLVSRKSINLIWDIYPETMQVSGYLKRSIMRLYVCRYVFKSALRLSSANIFIGDTLRNNLEAIYGRNDNNYTILVGADSSFFQDEPRKLASPHTILYCGNLGRLHDTDTIAELLTEWNQESCSSFGKIGREASPKLFWKFHCGGAGRNKLINLCSELSGPLKNRIIIKKSLKIDEWVAAMTSSSLALVTMKKGAEFAVFPSKVFSAMMAGQAVIAIAPGSSDLARMVQEVDCGWCIEPGETDQLNRLLKRIVSNEEDVYEKRKNARTYAIQNLTQEKLSEQWHAVLTSL